MYDDLWLVLTYRAGLKQKLTVSAMHATAKWSNPSATQARWLLPLQPHILHPPVASYIVVCELQWKYSKRGALFPLILQYVWLREDDCYGSPLIAPSVLYPHRWIDASHNFPTYGRRADRFHTGLGAAVHFIKETRRTPQKKPVLRLAPTHLRNQTSQADEAWCCVLEPTATFALRMFPSPVCHLESVAWYFCSIPNQLALDGLCEGGFHSSGS